MAWFMSNQETSFVTLEQHVLAYPPRRDVGLNQIALFEGKVVGGNGVLSKDVYKVGEMFDFFRMLYFYFTTIGQFTSELFFFLLLHLFFFVHLRIILLFFVMLYKYFHVSSIYLKPLYTYSSDGKVSKLGICDYDSNSFVSC